MKLKLDENLGRRGAAILPEAGHEVRTIARWLDRGIRIAPSIFESQPRGEWLPPSSTVGPKPDDDRTFKLRPGVLVAEAELRPNEVQDLGDHVPELRKAAGETDLKFRIRLELDLRGGPPDSEVLARLNEILGKFSKTLIFNNHLNRLLCSSVTLARPP